MTVLDEEISSPEIQKAVKRCVPGRVAFLTEFAPVGTADAEIPRYLRECGGRLFITTNCSDFWRKQDGHPAYCMILLSVDRKEPGVIFRQLRRTLAIPHLNHDKKRRGLVVRVTGGEAEWYARFNPPKRTGSAKLPNVSLPEWR